jgi:hypothetical protein
MVQLFLFTVMETTMQMMLIPQMDCHVLTHGALVIMNASTSGMQASTSSGFSFP